ncbi:alpha-protein kinase vwkA-like [Symsagittifera roscoffensis]|uniref:alpha-protein kinase vwkA-like n=1 Tax=Symsagittifera roscoffensis TaxID=84072 RepID=UPI00307B7874
MENACSQQVKSAHQQIKETLGGYESKINSNFESLSASHLAKEGELKWTVGETEGHLTEECRRVKKNLEEFTEAEIAIKYENWEPDLKASEEAQRLEWVAVEPFMEGEYKKFNSNSGAVFLSSEALAAFSHFTYIASDCKFVVCDLQGIRADDYYYLTDPAICSRDQSYGPTDIGVTGINAFFERHECTKICKNFDKPDININYVVKGLQPKTSSTYTFELSTAQNTANRDFRNRKDLPAVSE